MACLTGTVYKAFLADQNGNKIELPSPSEVFANLVPNERFEDIRLDDIDLTITFVCVEPLPGMFRRLFAPYTMTLAERVAAEMRSRMSPN